MIPFILLAGFFFFNKPLLTAEEQRMSQVLYEAKPHDWICDIHKQVLCVIHNVS